MHVGYSDCGAGDVSSLLKERVPLVSSVCDCDGRPENFLTLEWE